MDLGYNLAQLRREKGLNQRTVANALGVSNGAIAMWETNKRQPDLEMIIKIANYYDVSLDFLLKNTEWNNLSMNDSPKKSKLEETKRFYSHAMQITSEDEELLTYYRRLSQEDKRWIMGQMIDLIKKIEHQVPTTSKVQ